MLQKCVKGKKKVALSYCVWTVSILGGYIMRRKHFIRFMHYLNLLFVLKRKISSDPIERPVLIKLL